MAATAGDGLSRPRARAEAGDVLRYLWAGPNTLLGLALALLAVPGGRLCVVDGVIEAHGPILQWLLRRLILVPGGAAAMTIGHVVLGADARALVATRAHERVHVRQYERWGPFFIPAYFGASLWTLVREGHPYVQNRFEREARDGSAVRLGTDGDSGFGIRD